MPMAKHKRWIGCLSMVVAGAGLVVWLFSGAAFPLPNLFFPDHLKAQPGVPEKARQVTDAFGVDNGLISDVYYYSSRSLRCNYYLRASPRDAEARRIIEESLAQNAEKVASPPRPIMEPPSWRVNWWLKPSSTTRFYAREGGRRR